MGNVVVDGVSTPSVEHCYHYRPCETIALPVPADAPGGARVESVSGPTSDLVLATGVTHSSTGDLPTIWRVDPTRRPYHHWLVDSTSLASVFGTGLDAVSVTWGGRASEPVFVLRRTTAARPDRGTDIMVERAGTGYHLINPLGCRTRGWTVSDVVTVRLQLAFAGNCGTAGSALPRVYVWKTNGVIDVTRGLPSGVRWTRTDQAPFATSDDKFGLAVRGEPVAGGSTVSYRLAFGHWVPLTGPA